MASLAHNKSTIKSDIVGWGPEWPKWPEVGWSKTGFLPPVWTSGRLSVEMGKKAPGRRGICCLEVEGTDALQMVLRLYQKRQQVHPIKNLSPGFCCFDRGMGCVARLACIG